MSAHIIPITTVDPPLLAALKAAYKVSTEFPDFAAFLKYIASPAANAELPAPQYDYTKPIASYFISTSHNTYLTGHQLYGSANIDGYKTALRQGCRCVEIDCWNGEQEKGEKEPQVLHGYTATKKIPFRTVCEAIKENAFTVTALPLILSLEVHTNHEQQQQMVDIMNEIFKDQLVAAGHDLDFPTPDKLRQKILIKVKYNPATEPLALNDLHLARTESTVSEDSDDKEKEKKPSKIIAALSQMGVFTRSYHFKSLSHPDCRTPHHVFSLSESQLTGVHKEDSHGLLSHNKRYLMRTYPKGTRIGSSNLDPSLYWRMGTQLVALNWQSIDKGMMLQNAMFSGTTGWVLKPDSFAPPANKKSFLRITFLGGQNLPLAPESERIAPYVKVEVHLDRPGSADRKTKGGENDLKRRTITVKGQAPHWEGKGGLCTFDALPSLVPEVSFVRFKVMHDKIGPDQFASWACIRLDRLGSGWRVIKLWDSKGNASEGILVVHLEYGWNI